MPFSFPSLAEVVDYILGRSHTLLSLYSPSLKTIQPRCTLFLLLYIYLSFVFSHYLFFPLTYANNLIECSNASPIFPALYWTMISSISLFNLYHQFTHWTWAGTELMRADESWISSTYYHKNKIHCLINMSKCWSLKVCEVYGLTTASQKLWNWPLLAGIQHAECQTTPTHSLWI